MLLILVWKENNNKSEVLGTSPVSLHGVALSGWHWEGPKLRSQTQAYSHQARMAPASMDRGAGVEGGWSALPEVSAPQ